MTPPPPAQPPRIRSRPVLALYCRYHQILWQFQRNNVRFYGEILERQLPEIQIVVGETVTFVWAEGEPQGPDLRRVAWSCRGPWPSYGMGSRFLITGIAAALSEVPSKRATRIF